MKKKAQLDPDSEEIIDEAQEMIERLTLYYVGFSEAYIAGLIIQVICAQFKDVKSLKEVKRIVEDF